MFSPLSTGLHTGSDGTGTTLEEDVLGSNIGSATSSRLATLSRFCSLRVSRFCSLSRSLSLGLSDSLYRFLKHLSLRSVLAPLLQFGFS